MMQRKKQKKKLLTINFKHPIIMSNYIKHDWENKQGTINAQSVKSDFEKAVERANNNPANQPRYDKVKMKSYTPINGIPHKIVDGKFEPLTKIQ